MISFEIDSYILIVGATCLFIYILYAMGSADYKWQVKISKKQLRKMTGMLCLTRHKRVLVPKDCKRCLWKFAQFSNRVECQKKNIYKGLD